MTTTRQQIEKMYGKLTDNLERFSDGIKRIEGVNNTFDSIQNRFIVTLDEKIVEANNQLNSSLSETIWDNLVIAFFGVTGAGKSTIIETFRILFDKQKEKDDGLIVGDGSPDFTKVYEEYQLSIDGYPFTLIDVPGIEGNEKEYEEGIKKALHKAHCVFYVQGENKQPNSATALKIKEYLGDWVKVYSIFNVRGGSDYYDQAEERETLLTPGVRKTENLIMETFQNILNDVYCGNITIQGLLALCAKANFIYSRERLAKTQRKLLKYFISPENILKFSQFQTIINLVNEKSKNFSAEIIEANKQKIISLGNSIVVDLDKTINEEEVQIVSYKENLRTFRNNCNNIISTCKNDIKNRSKAQLYRSLDGLEEEIFKIFDNDSIKEKKKKVRIEQDNIKRSLPNILGQIVNGEYEKAQEKLKIKQKELNGISIHNIEVPKFTEINYVNIDFGGAIEELDVSFEDIASWSAKASGTAATAAGVGWLLGGPFGTAVGGVSGFILGGVAGALTARKRKSEAKWLVTKAIEKDKERTWKKVDEKISAMYNSLDMQLRAMNSSVKKELDNIERMDSVVNNAKSLFKEYVKDLNNKYYGTI